MSKKFLLFLILISLFSVSLFKAIAFDIPSKPGTYVNDYADILSKEEKISLENKISNFETKTSNEIAVVIISSLDGDTIENVAQNIFTKWGIGKKDKNNGVLILVAMAERKTRIHTGYGVEGSLTDIATSYIQSEIMTPAFRENNYFSGIDGALDKIIEALNGGNVVPENYSSSKSSGISFEFFIFGFFVLQWIVAILSRSKSWWAGGVLGALIGGAIWIFGSLSLVFSSILFVVLIIFGLGLDFLVSRTYQKMKNSGSRLPWWIGGGGFGGGSKGGGFGGFGGGFSGGGGSSGSW
ncbi:MAG: TPM domain-containing protein [Candidatus Paceibacterota bacterium]